jgi:hypothetical protein
MSADNNDVDASSEKVSAGIRKRIEKNREKALLLRKAKVISHPFKKS